MGKFEILHPQLAKIGYRAAYGKSPLPDAILAKGRQASMDYFTQVLEQGKRRGEIRSEVDSAAAAFVFSATLTQLGDFLAASAGLDTAEIAQEGYPVHSPVVRQMFDKIFAILQFGMAK